MSHVELSRAAVLSDDGRYRYWLRRTVGFSDRRLCFVMLNPSTADAIADDPTIRRCASFAKRNDCGQFGVVNLFAYRATDPRDLRSAACDITGGEKNTAYILAAARWADGGMVAAWGTNGGARALEILALINRSGVDVYRLGTTTKAGHPRHPLYLAGTTEIELHKGADQ